VSVFIFAFVTRSNNCLVVVVVVVGGVKVDLDGVGGALRVSFSRVVERRNLGDCLYRLTGRRGFRKTLLVFSSTGRRGFRTTLLVFSSS